VSSEADDVLFRKILYNRTHVLHSYLTNKSEIVYALRTRFHNKSLICNKRSQLFSQSYLQRLLLVFLSARSSFLSLEMNERMNESAMI